MCSVLGIDGPMAVCLDIVPKQVKILLQSIAGKNVKEIDAILDVPVLKQRSITIIMAGGNKSRALMAELADALDLGSNGRPCGSSPIKRI